jgi:hypothetical protein
MANEITKIEDVVVGEFVRYEDTDDKGKFHYDAKIITVNKQERWFEVIGFDPGVDRFNFKAEDDNNKLSWAGKLTKSEKPRGWDKFEKDKDVYRKKEADKKEVEQQIKATTKTKVFELVKANSNLDSKSLVEKAKKEIGGDDKLLGMFVKVALMQAARKK